MSQRSVRAGRWMTLALMAMSILYFPRLAQRAGLECGFSLAVYLFLIIVSSDYRHNVFVGQRMGL